MIYLKTASDFEKMRVAGAIVRDTLLLMEEKAKEGVTTAELNKIADAYIRKCGAEPSFLNYNGYPFSICASVNEEVVHGFPSKRALKDGDIVSIDVGAVINGFHGDAARTFLIGNVKEEVRKLVEVTKECFFKGIEAFKDGNRLFLAGCRNRFARARRQGASPCRARLRNPLRHKQPFRRVPACGVPCRKGPDKPRKGIP